MAKKKEAVKKTIPGAVFVEDQKDKSNQKKKEAEAAAATSSLTKQMSEIKISSAILDAFLRINFFVFIMFFGLNNVYMFIFTKKYAIVFEMV